MEEVRRRVLLANTSDTGTTIFRVQGPRSLLNKSSCRFVRMASDTSSTNRTILFADPPGSANYVYAEVPTSALNKEMMDVAFVQVVDSLNFPGGISALLRDHRFDEGGVNLGDHWKHKYLVDVDGMGYSGRFFSFLESDSAVLKATVYREFYEQWLEPWYELSHPTTCSPVSHDVFPQVALHPAFSLVPRNL